MVILAVVLVTVSLIYDPTMTLFFYTLLPDSYKTRPWFQACLLEENIAMAVGSSTAILAWQVHVIAFDLVNTTLKSIVCDALQRQVSYFH